MQAKAILFDTRSIQRYIFSGNKLRTNIGASYLVDTVYDEVLFPLLQKRFGASGVDTENWRQGKMLSDMPESVKCAVSSNGGGNLTLMLREGTSDELKDIVAEFSRVLLVERPGLHIGAAFDECIHLDEPEAFQNDITRLYDKLKNNQMSVFPEVNVPYTGLTLSCPVSGETANYLDKYGKIQPQGNKNLHFYSQEVAVKALAAEKSTNRLKKMYADISARYDFPMQLEDLGQREQENYIAIVHIDGNNMGVKFRACDTQKKRSQLSNEIRLKTEGCFGKLLESIAEDYDHYREYLDIGEEYVKEGNKRLLPIRPLILGGDDVTFVCPAKLALKLTKRFIEYMMTEDSVDGLTSEWARNVDCCAGIAILKTSYPFFRGYKLAESLCDEAKKKMRSLMTQKKNDEVEDMKGNNDLPTHETSWLDFAILHGEQAPTLKEIREQEYSGARGNMHFGPYQVGHDLGKKVSEHRYDIENLLEAVRQLQSEDLMAHNKIKKMRSVLQHGKHEAQEFLVQLEHQGQRLPDIPEWEVFTRTENALWSAEKEAKTPYVDAIEMMDFIPKEA